MTTNRDKALIENLTVAGCPDATIKDFLRLERVNKRSEQYSLLSRHRKTLLDRLHEYERRIDVLDYLVYTMNKEESDQ